MNGIRYLIITYPGYISLPEKRAMIYQLNGINVFAVVHEHLEAVQIIDFRNALKRDAKGNTFLEKPVNISPANILFIDYEVGDSKTKRTFVYDFNIDTEKAVSTIFYTVLTIAYEIADPDSVSQDDEALGSMLLSEFITAYKHVSKDARIRLPNDLGSQRYFEKEAIVKYSNEDKAKSIKDRLLTLRELPTRLKSFVAMDIKESVSQAENQILQNIESLKQFLASGQPVNEEFRLLLKAFEEIDLNRNFKYALLESFIVAETAISRVLYKLKLSKGVSKGKLDDLKKEIGISYQINVEMPLILDNLTADERQILGGIDKIRKNRNDVVHEGLAVTEEMAMEALNNAAKLLFMLISRNLL